jgi:hypothetical protein
LQGPCQPKNNRPVIPQPLRFRLRSRRAGFSATDSPAISLNLRFPGGFPRDNFCRPPTPVHQRAAHWNAPQFAASFACPRTHRCLHTPMAVYRSHSLYASHPNRRSELESRARSPEHAPHGRQSTKRPARGSAQIAQSVCSTSFRLCLRFA